MVIPGLLLPLSLIEVFDLQLISVAFGDVHSIKSAYSMGIEDRIYICFAKHIYVTRCKWNRFDKSDSYPI